MLLIDFAVVVVVVVVVFIPYRHSTVFTIVLYIISLSKLTLYTLVMFSHDGTNWNQHFNWFSYCSQKVQV